MSYIQVKKANLNHKEPQMAETPDGTLAANFRIAENVKKKNGEEHTNWFSVEAYGKQAELIRDNVQARDRIEVEGTFEVKEDDSGNKYPTIKLKRFTKPQQLTFADGEEDEAEEG